MSALESDPPSASTRPYLIRALYEWCADNGLTPYIAVLADQTVQAPREYVRDGQIVLNISADATSALTLDNDYIRFKARFGGVAREIIIPVDRVLAIYARENGQGMAFPVPEPEEASGAATGAAEDKAVPPGSTPLTGKAPVIKDVPGTQEEGGHSGMRLVPATPAASDSGDDDEPPTPTPPRPALKRIK
ncbi:MAG: ClpXP protease specificity-enhancing factor [Burkholderiaceae bacterium]|jgi:stringent starvation protein B|nr:ClpXP protease specificity-enhancing factor [Burkholderiaceae bacterium]